MEDANLEVARLEDANLRGADLRGANLDFAHLEQAELHKVDLSSADLTFCKVTREQLVQATSLRGAKQPFNMPPLPAPEVETRTLDEQAIDRRLASLHRARVREIVWYQTMERAAILHEDVSQKDDLLGTFLGTKTTIPDSSKSQ